MAVKKKKGGGGGSNWMDTYGDMVTLLLCFFVLLYSMSTISEDKWKAIVQSFNPNSIEQATATSGNQGPSADPDEGMGMLMMPGAAADQDAAAAAAEAEAAAAAADKDSAQSAIDAALDQLYDMLKEMADSAAQSGQSIQVTKGDGYIFVSFNDAVFFNGDSYALREEGRALLNVLAQGLDQAAPYIDELRIMGHTAQASPDRPNNVTTDRFLASNRATVTAVYLQERCGLDPARIVSMGYGQHRPVDTNATSEGRSHNRRVEMIITGQDLFSQLGDSLKQYSSIRSGEASLKAEKPEEATQ